MGVRARRWHWGFREPAQRSPAKAERQSAKGSSRARILGLPARAHCFHAHAPLALMLPSPEPSSARPVSDWWFLNLEGRGLL